MQIKTIRRILLIVICLFSTGSLSAQDGFSAVHCGADVRKALTGQKMTNEKVVVIENRHKGIGLKDLGGTEISDRLFLISWRICGDEYALLEANNVVHDVLKFPAHSKESPEFIGSCQNNEGPVEGTMIAVLEEQDQKSDLLRAKVAWRIDEKSAKFKSVSAQGLRCPRAEIISEDEAQH